jgi:SAM-dependent methyltransferase
MAKRLDALFSAYAEVGGVEQVFSTKVADYVAARPDYPAALFEALIDRCDLSPASSVIDVGAGTGLLSRGFLDLGIPVVGVEPNEEMRSAATALLDCDRGFSCLPGSAERLPLPDCSADLICAAQAFHWFDLSKTRDEWTRVLKPSAHVALIWNDRQPSDPLHQGLNRIFERFGGARRDALIEHENRRGIADFFSNAPIVHLTFPHAHSMTAAALRSLAMSRSYMPPADSSDGRLAEEAVARLHASLGAGEVITVRYTTHAYVGRLRN